MIDASWTRGTGIVASPARVGPDPVAKVRIDSIPPDIAKLHGENRANLFAPADQSEARLDGKKAHESTDLPQMLLAGLYRMTSWRSRRSQNSQKY